MDQVLSENLGCSRCHRRNRRSCDNLGERVSIWPQSRTTDGQHDCQLTELRLVQARAQYIIEQFTEHERMIDWQIAETELPDLDAIPEHSVVARQR